MKIEDVRLSLGEWTRDVGRDDPHWFDRGLFAMLMLSDAHEPDVDRVVRSMRPGVPWGACVIECVKDNVLGSSTAILNQLACVYLGVRWEAEIANAAGFFGAPMISPDAVDVDIFRMGIDRAEVYSQFMNLSFEEVARWALREEFSLPPPAAPVPAPPAELSLARLGAALEAIDDEA